MILSAEKLLSIGKSMMGLGAPIERDNVGFNRIDFSKMRFLEYADELTPKQCLLVVSALRKYKKTQLVSLADDIEETYQHYIEVKEKIEKETPLPKVSVLGHTTEEFILQWGYSKKASMLLKDNFDKSNGFWKKNQKDEWTYHLFFESANDFVKMMTDVLDTKELSDEIAKIDSYKATGSKKFISVSRDDDTIDTLSIGFEYNKRLVEVCKRLGGRWSVKKMKWEIPFTKVVEFDSWLADEIFDKSELQPWVNLFKGWNHKPELIDTKNIESLPFDPYDYQIEDAKKLLSLKTGLNGNEVGCGKTLEQILIGESIDLPKLVICPATLRLNWQKEIKMVNPSADISILYSDKPFKVGKDWTIVGYPSLVKFQKELENELFQVIMMDEAHYIQSISNSGTPDSQRAKAVLRLVATSEFVYPITGTPKTNRNKNIYNILRTIRHPLTQGKKSFFDFAQKFCDAKRHSFGWDFDGNSNDELLFEELQPVMVRRLKKKVLPDLVKMRQAIPVDVDLNEYREFICEYVKTKDSNDVLALTYLTKAKQSVAIQKVDNTIEFAQDIIDRDDEKVVIVTCFTEVVDRICKKFKCPKIVGGMSDKAKAEAIDMFQNGDAKVIVLNIVAGGVGITLTASHNMIMNDMPWTTGELEQAEGRIWRSGQTEISMIYYMVASGCRMDELLQDTITRKSRTINSAIDGGLGDSIDFRKLIG